MIKRPGAFIVTEKALIVLTDSWLFLHLYILFLCYLKFTADLLPIFGFFERVIQAGGGFWRFDGNLLPIFFRVWRVLLSILARFRGLQHFWTDVFYL